MARFWLVVVLATGLTACQSAPDRRALADATAQPHAPAFAEAVCGSCHGVEPAYASPNPMAPAFVDMANREGVTRASLKRFLRDANHYPDAMEFTLEEKHVEELANYILSLRDPARKRAAF